MQTHMKVALSLFAINAILVSSVQAGKVRDDNTQPAASVPPGEAAKWMPDGKGGARERTAADAQIQPGLVHSDGNGITYWGGPVMLGTTHVYYIWYGDWTGNTAKGILENFADSIGGTPWYNINTTYYQGSHKTEDNTVKNAVVFKGGVDDYYSRGRTLNDDDIAAIVKNQISSGKLPNDEKHGVYFVLTSADVTETSGFCTSYCAWHAPIDAASYSTSVPGTGIKFAFVGNPEQCPYDCIENYQTSMSGNLGADAMANGIAHELVESVSDPDITGWYASDPNYTENADLCAWTFGSTTHAGTAADPYPPNMNFNGIPYLIQQNWVNARGGYCALRYPRK